MSIEFPTRWRPGRRWLNCSGSIPTSPGRASSRRTAWGRDRRACWRSSGRHRLVQDGPRIVGDYEQEQFTEAGSFVLKWQLHWVAGWDPSSGEYRSLHADNYGHAGVMRGHIVGDRLTFESLGDPPVRIRLTWDTSAAPNLTWTNEVKMGERPWSLVETYQLSPEPA